MDDLSKKRASAQKAVAGGIWFASHFLHVARVKKPTAMRESRVRPCENCVRFSHGSRFFDLRNVQKRATKSDTSGHCLLLRFQSNSTAFSDHCALNLETMSGMILNKLQPLRTHTWLKAKQRPAFTGRAFIFDLRIFEQSATQNNHLLCCWVNADQPLITRSRRLVPNFKFSVLVFLMLMSCWMNIEQNCAKTKNFSCNLCPMWLYVSIKGLLSRTLMYLV